MAPADLVEQRLGINIRLTKNTIFSPGPHMISKNSSLPIPKPYAIPKT